MPRSTTIVAAALWACVAAMSACVDSNAVHCDDGRLCPADTICVDELDLCAHPDQLGECTADGADCEFLGTNGICRGDVCVAEGCGDSFVTGSEACDPERALAETEDECGDHGFQQGGAVRCNPDCTWDFEECQGICGDHAVDPGEECDTPELGEHDDCQDLGYYDSRPLTCTAACRYDRTICTGFCGDGDRNGPEACDETDLDGVDCEDLGFYFPDGLSCTPLCGFDDDACTGFCGDGAVNDTSEQCDGEPPTTGTCVTFGFDAGTLGCSAFCTPGFDACARSGWRESALSPATYLYDLWKLGPTAIIAVGDEGAIRRFDGVSWSTEVSPTAQDLHAITAAGADLYAVGDGGAIVRRSAGAWTLIPPPSFSGLEDVWASGPDDVIAVGLLTVVRFDGTTWTAEPTPGGAELRGVHGTGPADVFAVGNGGAIYHHDGVSWSAQASPTTVDLLAVWATSPTDAWAVGGAETFVHYDGTAWTVVAVDNAENMDPRAIWASGPRDVYVIGEGARHFDGERWWFIGELDNGLEGITGTGPSDVIALDGQRVSTYSGSAWEFVAPLGMIPSAVWGISPELIYATGITFASPPQGRFIRYDGTGWTPVTLPTAETMMALWGAGPDDVFAAGTQGTIVHFDGATWEEQSTPTTSTLIDLWADGPAAVHALKQQVGGSDVLTSTDGGAWTPAGMPGTLQMFALWGSGPDDIYVGGTALYRFDGAAWQTVTLPGPYAVRDIWGSGPDDVWVANGQVLSHFDGSAWSSDDIDPSDSSFTRLWGYAPDDVFATNGTDVFHYDGAAWAPVRLPPGIVGVDAMWGTPHYTYVVDNAGNSAALERTVPWSCRSAETGCGDGMDDDCDGVIDGDDADCAGALAFSEIHGALVAGEPDYLEIVNRTGATMNLSGVAITHRGGCGVSSYRFPPDAIVGPNQTYRVVDAGSAGEYARERSSGVDLCDEPTAGGWYALCAGPCDLAACTNVLDYVEKAGVTAPVSPPACADFTPAPIDVTLVSSTQSPTRVAFTGGTASDWTIADASRD